MVRLGVIGWPVAHSRSPAMFEAAFREYGIEHEWSYQKLPVPPELFEQTARALKGAGFLGANVTIPHKSAALALSDSASPAAKAIGAANTLTFAEGGSITAENTDAPGLMSALGCPVEGMRALVLGAGGSARAVVWALRDAGAQVSVWNRTHARAQELARDLDATAVEDAVPAGLLVNCTSVGLDSGARRPLASEPSALNQLPVDADQVGEYSHVVDLVYRNGDTPLIAAARSHGAHVVDGLEVLVAQGALSFELWTGRPAPREAMRRGIGIG